MDDDDLEDLWKDYKTSQNKSIKARLVTDDDDNDQHTHFPLFCVLILLNLCYSFLLVRSFAFKTESLHPFTTPSVEAQQYA
jgi:hypothetical protein